VDLTRLGAALDGELYLPGSPGYDAIRRPVNPAYRDVRPRLVARCRSVTDVVGVVRYAAAAGLPVVPRGGGHCFAGRSSTDGIVMDLSGLDRIDVSRHGVATVGAGLRLEAVYAGLHARGRTLPAGCGPTVGIAGLTLGGGIGLIGRRYGLTCDHLVGAQVVLADGSVVRCDDNHEPDLFWALRGAGGGQFGVVTSLRFATVPDPTTTRVEARWSGVPAADLVAAWQALAPELPDDVTVNLTLSSPAEGTVVATLFGAATLGEEATRDLVGSLTAAARVAPVAELRPGLPYSRLKRSFADPRPPTRPVRIRSEFFARPMRDDTVEALLTQLRDPGSGTGRQLAFTAMGGAYDRVPADATAYAHRGQRFLLEHAAEAGDAWVDRSWATAHTEGSGRVYTNFPDPALDDWAGAYHADHYARLAAVKRAYDPGRFFDFPQAV
jgi:FAD/FMN-containing dehydrogenase